MKKKIYIYIRYMKQYFKNYNYNMFNTINHTLNSFKINRDKMVGNNNYIYIFIYFFILFLIDYSGALDYYGQNIFRRCINMYRRTDPRKLYKKTKSFCKKYEKMLDKNDILKLQSIKIPIIKI